MKTMTCRQLGGPCELAFQAKSADEIIRAQDKHLKEMTANGDTDHQAAALAMKGRWKRPASSMKWYLNTKREFAALADD